MIEGRKGTAISVGRSRDNITSFSVTIDFDCGQVEEIKIEDLYVKKGDGIFEPIFVIL